MSSSSSVLKSLVTSSQRTFFHRHGFVVLQNTIFDVDGICQSSGNRQNSSDLVKNKSLLEQINRLHKSFEDCFDGKFNTGNYPDEWHWRKGISKPNATREICNGWKSDFHVREFVCGEKMGSVGVGLYPAWNSVRLAQDDLVWKVPMEVRILV